MESSMVALNYHHQLFNAFHPHTHTHTHGRTLVRPCLMLPFPGYLCRIATTTLRGLHKQHMVLQRGKSRSLLYLPTIPSCWLVFLFFALLFLLLTQPCAPVLTRTLGCSACLPVTHIPRRTHTNTACSTSRLNGSVVRVHNHVRKGFR